MNPAILSEDLDERAQAALDWACSCTGWRPETFEPASQDASFRRYFRIRQGEQCRIVMDAPPERESLDAFIDIAERLRRAGLHVPEIVAAERAQGFLLLSDLGQRPWHRVLDADNADRLFDAAIDALIRMQQRTDTTDLPAFDAALLKRELDLFPDWFLARHWQVEPTDAELDTWDHICALLIRWALDQARVFCHRDFMPRNLMDCEPNPGILDFQDAVIGPISYDPVCLFRDAFLSWPAERVDGWLEIYRQRAPAAGLPVPTDADLWRRTCDLIGAQRHLKVLGIFARIRYRDGKPHYLEDAPRFFAYLDHACSRNPELAPLAGLLAGWRKRASAG
ncbi:MAG: phosphotransferase [Wenzhouxiangellaceae bacterium]|nr:phosphotransferase [Wenzhouxiangellaceae bacterium]